MKVVKYKNHNLSTNSEAYQLYETWKRTGDAFWQKKLEAHLREVDRRYKELHYD